MCISFMEDAIIAIDKILYTEQGLALTPIIRTHLTYINFPADFVD